MNFGRYPPPGAEGWDIDGTFYPENPAFTLPLWARDMLTLWQYCQGGMGGFNGTFPDPGTVWDQPAVMIEAFAVMSGYDAELSRKAIQR